MSSPKSGAKRMGDEAEAGYAMESHDDKTPVSVVGGCGTWSVVAAKVVEGPDVESGYSSWIVDVEEGRCLWIIEAPREAESALWLLPGVVAVEPIPDLGRGPGELAA